MKRYNVALVGCGNISRMHFAAYQPHPDRINLVAACDPTEAGQTRAREDFGIPNVYSSIAEMVAGADWDVAVVCTPTFVREAAIRELAAAGKQIFVEKPMADSLAEASRMVALCDDAGVQLAVNQNFRHHYPFAQAKDLIASGTIGAVHAIVHQELTFRQDKGWRTDLGRHALSVMGIHWFDGFRWLLDDEPATISCHLRASPAIQAAGETDAVLDLRFLGGVIVSCVISFSSLVQRTETVVIGSQGTLRLTYGELEAYTDLAAGRAATPSLVLENPCRGEAKPVATYINFDAFLTALEGGQEVAHSGRDNVRTVRMLDAAYASNATGAPVDLTTPLPAELAQEVSA